MRKMYATVNLLLGKFSKCSVGVTLKNIIVLTLLCAYVVRLYQNSAETTENCINNSLRIFLFLPWRNSATEMFLNPVANPGGGGGGPGPPPPPLEILKV